MENMHPLTRNMGTKIRYKSFFLYPVFQVFFFNMAPAKYNFIFPAKPVRECQPKKEPLQTSCL